MQIAFSNRQSLVEVEFPRLESALRMILADAGFRQGTVSVAITEDAAIRNLNQRYLNHDYATDVLSFSLASKGVQIEGEIVVSAETAAREAPEYGWTVREELLLYVIHGALHLVGYGDKTEQESVKMRQAEIAYLRRCDVTVAEPLASHLGGETP